MRQDEYVTWYFVNETVTFDNIKSEAVVKYGFIRLFKDEDTSKQRLRSVEYFFAFDNLEDYIEACNEIKKQIDDKNLGRPLIGND